MKSEAPKCSSVTAPPITSSTLPIGSSLRQSGRGFFAAPAPATRTTSAQQTTEDPRTRRRMNQPPEEVCGRAAVVAILRVAEGSAGEVEELAADGFAVGRPADHQLAARDRRPDVAG